jgi:hypothetical protein
VVLGDASGSLLRTSCSRSRRPRASSARSQLDTGAPGALFGIATGPDGNGNQVIYFNDDNDNTVKMLSK